MAGSMDWVLLAYRVPREPSTPRIAVWRRLRRLGAAQIGDGLVALPMDARTKEQLEWVGDQITEAGGSATVWIGRVGSSRAERELATTMADSIADEYRQLIAAAEESRAEDPVVRRRTLARLRRELRRVNQRDYFPPIFEREAAHAAVEALGVESVVAR